jgi:hypothetical protein
LTNAPSSREVEMLERVAREEAGDRRIIVRVQIAGGVILVVSTFLAWMNHPVLIHRRRASPSYFVREVSHSIGLTTMPAGLIAVGLGALAVITAVGLRRTRGPFGWIAVGLALGALGDTTVEIVQLLLGRRIWLDHFSAPVTESVQSPLANAVGAGVWLAAFASVALVANSLTYLLISRRRWKDASSRR